MGKSEFEIKNASLLRDIKAANALKMKYGDYMTAKANGTLPTSRKKRKRKAEGKK